MTKAAAWEKASALELDMILVQDGNVPVIKVCDLNKLEYEKQKGQKFNKPKKAKCVKIGPHTQEYDLQRLAKQAGEFIAEGHHVTIEMDVRGRDRMFKDLIKGQFEKFVARVEGAKPGPLSCGERTYTQSLSG